MRNVLGGATCSPLSLSTVKSTSVVCIRNLSRDLASSRGRKRKRERLPIEIELCSFRASGSYTRITPLFRRKRGGSRSQDRPRHQHPWSSTTATTTATFCHFSALPYPPLFPSIYIHDLPGEWIPRAIDRSWILGSWSRRNRRDFSFAQGLRTRDLLPSLVSLNLY